MIHALRSAAATATLGVMLMGWGAGGVHADSVVLNPVKDNTLINSSFGEYSNGKGDSVFSGRTGLSGGNQQLRAVMKFDLSAIPSGSIITSASLTLYQVATVSGGQLTSLHRLLADWGEGVSVSTGGGGAPAEFGDATWNYRFFPFEFWSSPGGDFVSLASASTICEFSGVDYLWTSEQMTADVQGWVNDPCGNFGWILIGNEADTYTAKRYASREWADDLALRPRLSVTYAPQAVCAGDVNHSGVVDIDDLVAVITSWGACIQACNCPPDTDHNGTVDIDDLVAVITHWGSCPAK